ncbi:hypothetical protein BDK51DRAFT_30086 [Blyttiomyces helicus]|uniref:Uncharacterized protein n=1 Tax=Blyttiomyces helicus TaxID=388810 RepID=A0A4P9WNI3_9FUNG|nr:hypothetical protein BDK51DRAFT_30086 [Blyttiomyces helicus]|eukprot:RKO93258.1 hypothetical protein BDK51DRAFT_30086 [Blyttiomyces helicus]
MRPDAHWLPAIPALPILLLLTAEEGCHSPLLEPSLCPELILPQSFTPSKRKAGADNRAKGLRRKEGLASAHHHKYKRIGCFWIPLQSPNAYVLALPALRPAQPRQLASSHPLEEGEKRGAGRGSNRFGRGRACFAEADEPARDLASMISTTVLTISRSAEVRLADASFVDRQGAKLSRLIDATIMYHWGFPNYRGHKSSGQNVTTLLVEVGGFEVNSQGGGLLEGLERSGRSYQLPIPHGQKSTSLPQASLPSPPHAIVPCGNLFRHPVPTHTGPPLKIPRPAQRIHQHDHSVDLIRPRRVLAHLTTARLQRRTFRIHQGLNIFSQLQQQMGAQQLMNMQIQQQMQETMKGQTKAQQQIVSLSQQQPQQMTDECGLLLPLPGRSTAKQIPCWHHSTVWFNFIAKRSVFGTLFAQAFLLVCPRQQVTKVTSFVWRWRNVGYHLILLGKSIQWLLKDVEDNLCARYKGKPFPDWHGMLEQLQKKTMNKAQNHNALAGMSTSSGSWDEAHTTLTLSNGNLYSPTPSLGPLHPPDAPHKPLPGLPFQPSLP